jgi:hypothetical protein
MIERVGGIVVSEKGMCIVQIKIHLGNVGVA